MANTIIEERSGLEVKDIPSTSDTSLHRRALRRLMTSLMLALALVSATLGSTVGSTPAEAANPPGAVTGLKVVWKTASTATVSWNAASGATSYQVQYQSKNTGWVWKVDSDYKTKTATSYVVTGLGSGATYKFRVLAANLEGVSKWVEVTYVNNPPVPAAPTGLKAVWKTASTATVSWNAVSGATSYEVQYQSKNTGWVWKTDTDYKTKTATSYVVTGLGSGATYKFQVRAVNASGVSKWVEVTYVNNPPAPAAVTGLKVVWKTASTATVSWSAVSGATSYEVQYQSKNTNWVWKTDTDYKTKTATSYVVTGLGSGATYKFQVRAVNASGVSKWVEVTYVNNPPAPTAPTGLKAVWKTASTATVSWTAVSGATSYEAQVKDTTGKWVDASEFKTKTNTSFVPNGLKELMTYTYHVRAVNAGGASAWVEVKYTHMQPVPGTPTGLTVTWKSISSATVQWNAVSGATFYDLEYKSSEKTATWKPVQSKLITGTSVSSNDLKEGVAYSYRVRSGNGSGVSAWLTREYTHTKLCRLGAPTGLKASLKTSSTATVQWTAAECATSYEVQYQSKNTSNLWEKDTDYSKNTATSYVPTRLSVGVTYKFRVRAVNSSEVSQWVETSYVQEELTSDGWINYQQCDSRWGGQAIPGGKMCADGCGPSSYAAAITALTNTKKTPSDVVALFYTQGSGAQGISGGNSDTRLVTSTAGKFGLKTEAINLYGQSTADSATNGKITQINKILDNGGMVWLCGTAPKGTTSPFTSQGHCIVVRGKTADGKWKVFDSYAPHNTNSTYAPKDVAQYVLYNAAGIYKK